jgi:rhodanese-related sulfurtransferase
VDARTFEQAVREARSRIREIDADAARARLDETPAPTFLDVREGIELARGGGTVPGAVHVPLGELPYRAREALPSADAAVVVICAHGNRSALAADLLVRMGYKDVASLAGGWQAWASGGHPRGRPRDA